MPLAWLWFVLINHLRLEWAVNAQYSYGWAVPFLCALLLWRRIQHPTASIQHPVSSFPLPAPGSSGLRISTFYLLLSVFAFCYLPTRLIQEANPDWRLVSWAMALEVIGITLCVLDGLGAGRFPVSAFRFPLLFFLVAVPWPTLLEMPLIQALTRMDVGVTAELVSWFGIPAMRHGNVIEVATGVVGIDEACSGIRSFQATLMISLFLGEWLRLTRRRRAVLVLAGFLFSLLFNLARLLVLVWVASRDGITAASRWHDPAGVMILLGCFSGLWVLAHAWARRKASIPDPASSLQSPAARPPEISAFRFPLSALLALSVWLLFVEIGVEAWYRVHEAKLPAPVTWNIVWPANTVVKDLPIAPEACRILRFDAGQNRQWQADGFSWQVVFLRWNPGSVAARLTANHTPEVCLTATGHRITAQSGLQILPARGLQLPFRFYQLGDLAQPVFVGYCLWEDRAHRREFSTGFLNWGNRFAPVLAGQRNAGQRSLEIVVAGVNDFAAAQAAVQKLLGEIISVKH